MTDVLERYRAMLETPSVLAVDTSALLRDMAAEIERHRGQRVDMNEKAIEAVIAAARKIPRATTGPGGASTMHKHEIMAADTWELDRALRTLDTLPPLRAREEIAQEASEIAVVGSRHALDPQDATTSVDGMDIIEMLQDPALTNCTNTELFSYAVDEITGLRERLRAALSRTAGQEWRDISSAPKDGTLLQLLVSHEKPGESSANPTENEIIYRTIGHNNFDHDGTDEWKFAGWNWENDYWTEGHGDVTHWMPLPAPPVAGPKP